MTLKAYFRRLVAVPLLLALLLCGATYAMRQRMFANVRECVACAEVLTSLAPQLEAVRAYDDAKARLRAAGLVSLPEPRLGIPLAKRSAERGPVLDGWSPFEAKYEWASLKTGQAFAVLESFTSGEAGPWRIAELRLAALPDGENASLSVRLESAEPAPEQE